MYSYLVCGIFWIIFTLMLCMLGAQICKQKSFSGSLTYGYLFYSFLVAIGGMIVQIFNLPWIGFAGYMVVLWCAIIFLLIKYRWKRNDRSLFKDGMLVYLQNNWMILFVMIILIGLTCLYFSGFWLGNHQDDGYYITKVATMPYTQTGGNFVYPIGKSTPGFNTYIVNTWEIEASFYVKILNVSPTLYLRFFQTIFVFFLYLNIIKFFADKVIKKTELLVHESLAQFIVVIVIFFDAYYLFLSDTGIFNLRDMFMVNTGMFLGNSIVRMLSLFLLVSVAIDYDKISMKMVGYFIVVSVVLMSKSTIALPIIGVAAVSGFVTWLWFEYGKDGRICALACTIIYACLSAILPNQPNIQKITWLDTWNILRSPLIWICVLIFISSFFVLRFKIVYKLNMFVCIIVFLCVVPQINDVFEVLSVFPFVAGRAVTTIVYFFVVMNAVYLMLYLNKWSVGIRWIKRIYTMSAIVLTCVSLWGFTMFGGNVLMGQSRQKASIRFALAAIKHNPYFIPNSTIELGEQLDEMSQESSEQIRVVTDKMVIRDGTLHPLAIWLRIYAKNIIPVSATERYSVKDGSPLSEYRQSAFEVFESNPSDETAEKFWDEIKKLDVNCIVVQNPECAQWLEQKGYKFKEKVADCYYIWYK